MSPLVLSLAVSILGASVTPTEAGLELHISTGAPVPAAGIRAQVDTQGLIVTVPDAELSLAEQEFGATPFVVRARRMAGGVSLELPTGAGRQCAGPAVVPAADGVTVSLPCVARDATAFALTSGGASWTGWLAAVLLLLSAGGWVWFQRQRPAPGTRLVEVLDTVHLGPKRAILVARVGRERFVLGSSEAGFTLLATRPDEEAPAVTRPALAQVRKEQPRPFRAALDEATEDEELRQKLADGLRRSS